MEAKQFVPPTQQPQQISIGPQPGPQTAFLTTAADIAIYGGASGGGKSFGLLLEPLYHYENPRFGGVIFRRTTVQVRNEGGLWDEAVHLYSELGASLKESTLEVMFHSGMHLKFAHLEYDNTVYDWQGSQIAFIGFDELTHFTEKQFWYMTSRNRSMSGVPGYVRATCNPDRDSWVRKLIDWWIGEDGFPIKDRSGVLRWFIRQNDSLVWANTKQELLDTYGKDCLPKSLTFIAANIEDNKILMEKDPSYLASLEALPRVERERLRKGNWNVRAAAGDYFQRGWFPVLDALPGGWVQVLRYWDRASTKPSESNPNPDWSRGLKMYKYPNGTFVVGDLASCRDTPLKVEALVKTTASQDGRSVSIRVEQDPGSAGVADADNYVRLLAGYDVRVTKPSVDKVTRALGVSAQAERGNISLLRGVWNEDFLNEVENFPPESGRGSRSKDQASKGHDDIVDTLSGAFNELCTSPSILDVL